MTSHPISFLVFSFLLGNALAGMYFYDSINVFLVDGYAKRLGFAFAGAAVLISLITRPLICLFPVKLIIIMAAIVILYSIRGLYVGNPIGFIVVEIVQLIFIFLSVSLAWSISNNKIEDHLWVVPLAIICALLVAVNIKLQLSYAGFLAGILLICGYRAKSLIAAALFLVIAVIGFLGSLLGKSVLVFSGALLIFVFRPRVFLHRNFYRLMFLCFAAAFIMTFVFPNFFSETGLYRKTIAFISLSDFGNQSFDLSTAQRILEASMVIELLTSSGPGALLFGHGLGAFIDLSSTLDPAVAKTHENLSEVRNIHFMFFYLLLKFGLLGVIGVYGLLYFYCKAAYFAFYEIGSVSRRQDSIVKALILYSLIIIIDGQVSAGHLMSNPLFIAAAVLSYKAMKSRDNEPGKSSEAIGSPSMHGLE